jgi:hypothetical protein
MVPIIFDLPRDRSEVVALVDRLAAEALAAKRLVLGSLPASDVFNLVSEVRIHGGAESPYSRYLLGLDFEWIDPKTSEWLGSQHGIVRMNGLYLNPKNWIGPDAAELSALFPGGRPHHSGYEFVVRRACYHDLETDQSDWEPWRCTSDDLELDGQLIEHAPIAVEYRKYCASTHAPPRCSAESLSETSREQGRILFIEMSGSSSICAELVLSNLEERLLSSPVFGHALNTYAEPPVAQAAAMGQATEGFKEEHRWFRIEACFESGSAVPQDPTTMIIALGCDVYAQMIDEQGILHAKIASELLIGNQDFSASDSNDAKGFTENFTMRIYNQQARSQSERTLNFEKKNGRWSLVSSDAR